MPKSQKTDAVTESGAAGQFRFEDGELVLSDNESADDKQNDTEDHDSRKNRRKQTFERRNIKKVREDALNEEAKAAQQAEMERRKRLLGKNNNELAKFSNIDFLLNDGTASIEHCSSTDSGDRTVLRTSEVYENGELPKKRLKLSPVSSVADNGEFHLPTDELTKQSSLELDGERFLAERSGGLSLLSESSGVVNQFTPKREACEVQGPCHVSTASASLFGPWNNRTGYSQDDAILLGDSDDEFDKRGSSNVIELSDGDEDPDEPEFETEICELQDAANLTDSNGQIMVNPNRSDTNDPEITLAPQVSRVIKPHQVSGIRFLYDNLIEGLQRFNSTDGFGCILAHSMGLGKTIQVIGFLDAIFRHCAVQRVLVIVPINTIQNWQAEFEMWLPTRRTPNRDHRRFKQHNTSGGNGCQQDTVVDPTSCDQITTGALSNLSESNSPNDPVSNRTYSISDNAVTTERNEMPKSSTAPLSDLLNGSDADFKSEFSLRPFKLFVVRDIIKTMTQRHQIIRDWYEQGGVLLLGYEMFRLLLNRKRMGSLTNLNKLEVRTSKRRKKKDVCVDVEKEEKREQMWADFRTALLDPGPQLVICDEGHRIKNSEASISKALKAICTRRRVVLTGYPLQNNLMEYWCMVDFVRPNYLGTKQEFTNMFQRPIENGQCIDSTTEDRKVMQGRAHVLHDLLSGFVQRRSHAVLKASLPPKTETVLLIKMSPLQRTLYAAFMKSLGSSGPYGWAQVNTLKTYAMCCKIWNHPDILWRAMEEHKEAMDFDIDDPSVSSGSSKVFNRTTSSISNNNSSSNSLLASCTLSSGLTEQHVAMESRDFSSPVFQFPTGTQAQLPTYMNFPNPAAAYACIPNPNSFLPFLTPPLGSGFTAPLPTAQSVIPANLPPVQQASVSAGAYDWAGEDGLWGSNFKSGNVEHGGKVVLFLTLLEECVLAGDKVLVFTQSLYTLDLLERILRRLPLPSPRKDNNIGSVNPDMAHSWAPSMDANHQTKYCEGKPLCCGADGQSNNDTQNGCSSNTASFSLDGTEDENIQFLLDSVKMDKLEQTEEKHCQQDFLRDHCKSNDVGSSERPSNGPLPEASVNSPQLSVSEVICPKPSELLHDPAEEKEEEETLRSLHYRLATRRGRPNAPTVWTRNVHYFRLDGSTTASEREKLINNFNDVNNPSKLFLVSTRAGSLGVNLIGANRVVVFDASWNPCHDCQAVCRVYRYGQVKPCHIYRLVSDNTMEKKIYDRQITKQGMSDRVVDELNPTQQFTRSQVELLMSFEDKDMECITEEDVSICEEQARPDPVLATVLQKHRTWITKKPFTHESLLIDRKDYRLTRVEKRQARQRYEQEKRLSMNYQQAHLFQLQQMQQLQQRQYQQLLAAGINPALVDNSRLNLSRVPNILSRSNVNYRPTYTSGMAALDAMRQVERESRSSMLLKDINEARSRCDQLDRSDPDKNTVSDCKVTRIVATSDLDFPSTSNSTTVQRKIPKGEVMEVIQTSKGKYLRITRTGDLFVVKTKGSEQQPSSSFGTDPTTHTASVTESTSSIPSCVISTTSFPNSVTNVDNSSLTTSMAQASNGTQVSSQLQKSNTKLHAALTANFGKIIDNGRNPSITCMASDHHPDTQPHFPINMTHGYSDPNVFSPTADQSNVAELSQHFQDATNFSPVSSTLQSHPSTDRLPDESYMTTVRKRYTRHIQNSGQPTDNTDNPTIGTDTSAFTPINNNGALFEQQYQPGTVIPHTPQQHQEQLHLQPQSTIRQQQHQHSHFTTPWSCLRCGRSVVTGCKCSPTASIAQDPQSTRTKQPTPHPLSSMPSSSAAPYDQNVSAAHYTPQVIRSDCATNIPHNLLPQSQKHEFALPPGSCFEPSNSTTYYQAVTAQQPFLRTVEGVAQQNTGGTYFVKQDMSSPPKAQTPTMHPGMQSPHHGFASPEANHNLQLRSPDSHDSSSTFTNSVSMMQDYFVAQLTGNQSSDSHSTMGNPVAAAAAVRHYLTGTGDQTGREQISQASSSLYQSHGTPYQMVNFAHSSFAENTAPQQLLGSNTPTGQQPEGVNKHSGAVNNGSGFAQIPFDDPLQSTRYSLSNFRFPQP